MSTYKQLTTAEREQITVLLAEGKNQNQIAMALGRDRSTILRELRRNGKVFYKLKLSEAVDKLAKKRKRNAALRSRAIDPNIKKYVYEKLLLGWSPLKISKQILIECPKLAISHEAIYMLCLKQVQEGDVNLWDLIFKKGYRKEKISYRYVCFYGRGVVGEFIQFCLIGLMYFLGKTIRLIHDGCRFGYRTFYYFPARVAITNALKWQPNFLSWMIYRYRGLHRLIYPSRYPTENKKDVSEIFKDELHYFGFGAFLYSFLSYVLLILFVVTFMLLKK